MITLAMLELSGRFVPLVTPYTDDGATLGEVRLARLMRFYVEQKVDGFVVATETGEFSTLSLSERKQLVEWIHRSSQSVPMVVNVSTLSTSFSLDLAQHAARHGARAVVIIPPYFGEYSQSELSTHIRVISGHSSLPIIVVDPQQRLREEAMSVVSQLTNVHIGWSQGDMETTHSDWFKCYGLVVEPMAGVPSSRASDFILRNRAAVAKSLLMDFDLEVGPPRMPVLPIPYQEIRRAA